MSSRPSIVKFLVCIETEQADQQLALLHDDRQRRRNEIGAIGPVDEIDLIDVEQLGVCSLDSIDRRSSQAGPCGQGARP